MRSVGSVCLVVALLAACGSKASDPSHQAPRAISVSLADAGANAAAESTEVSAPIDGGVEAAARDAANAAAAAAASPAHEADLIECTLGPGPPERDAGPPLPPFSREAASAALARAGVNAQPCLRLASPPLASVHAKLTFLPTGVVNNTATVDEPADAPANVVTCIVQLVNRLRVPPFAGGPVSVGKRFSLRQ